MVATEAPRIRHGALRLGHHVLVGSDWPVDVSGREAEVLAALGEHLSNAQIAHRLHISVRTVESHVSSLLRKFGVTDRRSLSAFADQAAAGAPARAGRRSGEPDDVRWA